MTNSLEIPTRFRGPPHSGNGGYVAGIFASALAQRHNLPGQAVEVTLRAPTPLDTPLSVEHGDSMLTVRAAATSGATLIAEARIVPFELDVPRAATWAEALAAQPNSYSLPTEFHPQFNQVRRGVHPICFCCGAEAPPTEGLHVYSAPIPSLDQVAAAWRPSEAFASGDTIAPEFLWTALDCPGQMAWRAAGIQTGMLGRLTARIERSVRAGERCVVSGWTLGREGRKFFAGTALFNEAGDLCAYAKAVWIGRPA